jgi:hypothetical protein
MAARIDEHKTCCAIKIQLKENIPVLGKRFLNCKALADHAKRIINNCSFITDNNPSCPTHSTQL